MITTISEYYKNGGTIFDSSLLTYAFMSSNIITALDNILKYRYGKNNIFSDDETEITDSVNAMFLVNSERYNALFNVDQLINPADEYQETKTNTGTQESRKTGTTTLNDTGTSTTADTGTQTTQVTPETVSTVTNSKNTSDNGTMRAIDQTQTSSTGSDTSVRTDALNSQRTDNLQHQRTDNLTDTRTDNLTEIRRGYNNKFANADFILNLTRNNLYDTIIEDTIKCIVIPIYNTDEV